MTAARRGSLHQVGSVAGYPTSLKDTGNPVLLALQRAVWMCVESVSRFIEAGVDHVTIRPIGNDLGEQLRIYLEEVLPALGS